MRLLLDTSAAQLLQRSAQPKHSLVSGSECLSGVVPWSTVRAGIAGAWRLNKVEDRREATDCMFVVQERLAPQVTKTLAAR